MRKCQTTTINIFLLFLRFYISNLYFIRKYIWKNLVDIFIFVLDFLRGRLLEIQE